VKPDKRFLGQPKAFWAHVRTISQQLGYTDRGTQQIRVNSIIDMEHALDELGLSAAHIIDQNGNATAFGRTLHDYFEHRAVALNTHAQHHLMTLAQARNVYTQLHSTLAPSWPTPMNKQKGDKKGPAYFTGIINILIEAHIGQLTCDFDPRELTTFTRQGMPLRTFARRVDGAFPSVVSPIAIWEIKEYYYTTTFGSRVADGVYESLLDGLEIEELREHEGIDVKHYLMVDDHNTWWNMGRSYLCRIVDMLHMGYVDEVLFGAEVVSEMPRIVSEWVQLEQARQAASLPVP
jgi:hypothetical protein